MRSRLLGKTGLWVSEIGFGTWGIGGNVDGAIAYGPTDDRESKLALRRAFELGVTFYDTADFYGSGHSERLIGEALGDVRTKVVIASKVGLLDASGAQDFSVKHIRQSIENSLRRLRTDCVDLYQLHNPSMEALDRDDRILSTMVSLQTEGKIRAFGISLRSPADGVKAITEFGANSIQVNFSLADQRALENGLLALCEERGVGVIVRTPLCFGFLTGQYSEMNGFDPYDHRQRWSSEQIKLWSKASRQFLSAVSNRATQSDAQMALRFCLSHAGVSTVIPGMLTREQVEENVLASELGLLGDTDLLSITKIYQENIFFVGK